MTAKMTAADLRASLKHATERMQQLRDESIQDRDRHEKHSETWTMYHAEVRAYRLSLAVLFANTNGEFGEDADFEGGAQ